LKQNDRPENTPIADLVNDEAMRATIQSAVDEANRAVSQAEAIKKFTILPIDWTEEGGQMTPSMKLKRSIVMKDHEAEITAIYS
jgi:long-chain acyl-CoA synthetase